MTSQPRRRIAVIGSGVAGLTAAYVAARTAHVTLIEADDRLGGHADTHVVPTADGELAIDTGFIVHNERTYPTLLRLFAELGIATQPSEMSLSVSDRQTGVEYAGALGLRGLVPTRRAAVSPTHWRMLAEIPRFHRRAKRLLLAPPTGAQDQTLRDFLSAGGFSAGFVRHFMEPLVAAVWSCDPDTSLDYPARYLFTFLEHHGMLGVFGSPQWRTVTGGSATYVAAVAEHLDEILLGTKVTSVREDTHGVDVTDGNGVIRRFDAVVVATHPAQALDLLDEPTSLQREVLEALPYSRNTALLHTDTSLLPDAPAARSSWNFRRPAAGEGTGGQVVVSYDLTRLMRLPTETHYLVTLGGETLVDPAAVIDRMEYEHPLYTPASVAAQRRLPELDTDRLAFAGAYHGWGFHEDGARSGLAAATRLGLPWTTPAGGPSDRAAGVRPGLYRTVVRHTRRTPMRRSFEHSSHTWLVDLDDLPDHGRLAALRGSWEARDHLGSPTATLRENVEAFLARHDVGLGPGPGAGRILMAAHPRTLGHCFNPISVFWCFDDAGRQAAVVVEVHNTYGDRHAYLVHPDDQGRATTAKAMYVSPFHGVDGHYEIAVPVPSDRLHVAITLHPTEGQPFTAALAGERIDATALRSLGASVRGSMLIRVHGIVLWLRRLPIQSRPDHHQEGVR